MKKENFIILRWLLFLPVTIISTIVAVRLLGYFNNFSMWRLGYSSTSLFSKFYVPISNGLANGCVFVYTGSLIVPRHKKYVAGLLALIINYFLIKELIDKYSTLGSGESFYIILFTTVTFISSVLTMFSFINPDRDGTLNN
jgi:hypothetical protein